MIYNNIFYDNWYTNLGYGVAIDGYPNSWSTTHALGTANAVYIEDNYFELYRHAVTSGNGANYVARYNTCKNNYQNAQTFDAHGKSASWPRGTQTVEIYNNTVNNAIVRWAGVAVRGGSGVVWGNTISGVQHGVVVQLENSGTSLDTAGYPALDQVGNPKDLYIWGNSITSASTPVYKYIGAAITANSIDYWIQEQRDFYQTQMLGYAPYTYPHPLRSTAPVPPPPTPSPPPTKKGKGHH